MHRINDCSRQQWIFYRPFTLGRSGQAATEFIIACVFVLVPLFIIIPLLGKYIDIKHAVVEQARYEAWEYTSWFGDNSEIMFGVKATENAGVKSFNTTRNEGIHYFLSAPLADTYGRDNKEYTANPLWVDHRGESLFAQSAESVNVEGDLDYHFGLEIKGLEGLANFLKDAQSFFKKAGDLLATVFSYIGGTPARFDAVNLNGYYKSEVKIKVRSLDDILPQPSLAGVDSGIKAEPLEFYSKAAVQTRTWSAGGREQALIQSRGLVFSTLFSPVSNAFSFIKTKVKEAVDWFNNNILGFLPFIPQIEIGVPGMPAFGYVAEDLVPYEHLQNEEKKAPKKLQQQKIQAVELDPEKLKEAKTPLDLLKDYKVPIWFYDKAKEE